MYASHGGRIKPMQSSRLANCCCAPREAHIAIMLLAIAVGR
jgi:hypothetical protein